VAIPPNVITPVMLIELPTPGVTGALGVAPAGQSWMELQNAATSIIDIHDHSGNGKGLPIVATSIDINADLPFNGFSAVEVGSIGLEARGATMVGPYSLRAYSYNGDFYFTNAGGTPVQITAGNSVAGAVGSISGMIPGTSVRYDSPTGSFIFEKASNVVAGIKAGPLFLTDGAGAGGNTIGISAPSGLAAGYSLTLPTALPGATKLLTLSAAGAVASTIWVDGTTIQISGSSIVGKPVGQQISAAVDYTASTNVPTAVPGLTVTVTNVAGRPVRVALQPDLFGGGLHPEMAVTEISGAGYGNIFLSLYRGSILVMQQSFTVTPNGFYSVAFFDVLDTPGAGAHVYTVKASVFTPVTTQLRIRRTKMVAYEI